MAKKRILVVDDELLIRDLLYDFFTEHGWDITIAENGDKALEHLRQRSYDVLLTDLKMPGVDGGVLIEKARGASPQMPVIVMTGYPSVDSAVHALRNRVYDYLTKPFNITRLYKTIQESVQSAEAQP